MTQPATIPPELLVPPPRNPATSATPTFTRVVLMLVLVYLAVTLGFSILEPLALATARRDSAIVTDKYTTHGKHGTTYHVEFKWHDEDDFGTVDSNAYRQIKISHPVPVRVIAVGGMHLIRLEHLWQHFVRERWPLWFLDALTITMAWLIIADRRKTRWLLRWGTPIMAAVVDRDVRRGKTTSYLLTVEYNAGEPTPRRKQIAVPEAFYDATYDDAAVPLLYDPARPKRAMIYGADGWRCAASPIGAIRHDPR